ncbi:NUDIX domain-containing protein [Streptomyces sp. HYC2]|uniref:NUDIX hydrolase n=1 Tax=Streptomyces sp. HYC2 TaxID=2955207 RepID=UPI0032B0696B
MQAEIPAGLGKLTHADLEPGMHEVSAFRPRRHRGDLALVLQQVIDLPISHDHVRSTVTGYLGAHPEDESELAVIQDLLDNGAEPTSRKEFQGHATSGAVLINDEGLVLHIHHLALGKWLLPGGHLEERDTTLREAALRELTEETGVRPETAAPAGDLPVHIDIHRIPANDAKGEPAHRHIDFRYVFRTGIGSHLTLQEEEVTGAAWRPVDSIADETLRERVRTVLSETTAPTT